VKSKKRLPAYGTGALAIFTSFGWQAYVDAAAAAEAAADASGDNLSEIVVTGVRLSLKDSIATKRNSDRIADNITTAEIGQLPDVTIAEELNRLPGVNTTRDRGNASQASIRGLGPRLILGLVNGREVASSEPSQDLRWEIYPSEVLYGAVVNKTQDATLVSGGIAATVDIRTISPLDYKGPEFSIQAGPTYNDEGKGLPDYSGWGYRGSLGLIKHVGDDFAFSLAASAQREKNGFPDFRTFGWNTPVNSGATPANPAGNTGDLNGDGVPDNTTWGLNTEIKEVTQDRYAFSGGAGWRVNDELTIKGDALWSQYEIKENQFQAWYGNNITGNWANGNSSIYNAPGNSYQIVNGSVVAADLNNAFPNYESEIARYDEKHTLAVLGLNAEWKTGAWDSQADVSYSDAWRTNRWQEIALSDVYPPNLAFNVTDGQVPYGATPGANPADPALQSIGGFRSNNGSNVNGTGESSGPEQTRDHLAAIALNFKRTIDQSFLSAVEFGGRFSDRLKSHHENQWGYCAGTGSTSFTIPGDQNSQVCPPGTAGQNGLPAISLANSGLSYFTAPSFTAPPLVYANFDSLFPQVYPNSAQPAGSDMPLVRTTVEEKTYEGFAMLDFKTSLGSMPLTGNIGVRVAHTSTTSSGYQSPDGGVTFTPVSVGNSYTDPLPSLNMALNLTDTQLLRFGTAIAISRPPLDALVTGYSLSTNGGTHPTGGGGNPTLDPFKAFQVDFSYEWYFHEESMLAIAPYYKDVMTYIGAGSSNQTIAGTTYTITSESNTPGGNIAGVEVTLQSRFYFLPGFLQDFGIYANHAQVESNIHEAAPVGNPYPMVGFARATSEFDLFYEKAGFETRVALKHHTAFTVAPTWVGTTLKMLAPETTLDASVGYVFPKNWSIRLQGRNLTNERARFSTDNNPQNLANDGGYQVYGRSYLLEFGFKH
jgi:iron complex outermembrane recepter protein